MVRIGAITLTACWLLWPSKQQVLFTNKNFTKNAVVTKILTKFET